MLDLRAEQNPEIDIQFLHSTLEIRDNVESSNDSIQKPNNVLMPGFPEARVHSPITTNEISL